MIWNSAYSIDPRVAVCPEGDSDCKTFLQIGSTGFINRVTINNVNNNNNNMSPARTTRQETTILNYCKEGEYRDKIGRCRPHQWCNWNQWRECPENDVRCARSAGTCRAWKVCPQNKYRIEAESASNIMSNSLRNSADDFGYTHGKSGRCVPMLTESQCAPDNLRGAVTSSETNHGSQGICHTAT